MARLIENRPIDTFYERLPPTPRQLLEELESRHGSAAFAAYLRCLLTELIHRRQQTLTQLPAGVANRTAEELDAVLGYLVDAADDDLVLGLPRHALEKDLAICAGAAMPIGGAWLVEERWVDVRPRGSGRSLQGRTASAPRRRVESRNWFQAARVVKRRAQKLVGLRRRCFVVHTLERHIRKFSADHQLSAFATLAELVGQRPEIEGVFRTSWFLDPAAVALSPGLGFLSELPVANGAQLWASGTPDADAFRDAVGKSGKRKSAYESGEYTPRLWSYYWPREPLLDWASG